MKNPASSGAEIEAYEEELDRQHGLLDDSEDEFVADAKAETQEEKALRLEDEIAQSQILLNKNFSVELLQEVESKSTEVKVIRSKITREQSVKESYRKKYESSFASSEDFEDLWKTQLRGEAMAKDAEQQTELGDAMKHPMYREI